MKKTLPAPTRRPRGFFQPGEGHSQAKKQYPFPKSVIGSGRPAQSVRGRRGSLRRRSPAKEARHLGETDHLTIVDNGKESVGDLIDKLVEKYPQYSHKTFGDKEFTEAIAFVSREKVKTGCNAFAIHFWDGESKDIRTCISEADRFKLKSYVWDTKNKRSIDDWHKVVNPEGDWYSKCLAEEENER